MNLTTAHQILVSATVVGAMIFGARQGYMAATVGTGSDAVAAVCAFAVALGGVYYLRSFRHSLNAKSSEDEGPSRKSPPPTA